MSNLLGAELDLENLLLRVPHVLGARVQMNADGSVEKVHVLANRSARAHRLAAEIERLLGERRALRVDPGVISVATLEEGAVEPDAGHDTASEPPRIELRRLTFEPVGELEIRGTVELRLNEIVFTGEATETDVPRARPALAARAILRALEFLRERGAAFYLEGVQFLTGFHAPVALALIQAVSPRDKRILTGVALVADSREEAAARATLAAVNRFYGSLRKSAEP